MKNLIILSGEGKSTLTEFFTKNVCKTKIFYPEVIKKGLSKRDADKIKESLGNMTDEIFIIHIDGNPFDFYNKLDNGIKRRAIAFDLRIIK